MFKNSNLVCFILAQVSVLYVGYLLEVEVEEKIVKTIETDVAIVSLRDDGIVISVDMPVEKDINNIHLILDAYKEITNGTKRPFFIDPTAMPYLSRAARKKALPVIKECMSAFAVVNKSSLSRFVMNLMLNVDGLDIPAKAVRTKEQGIEWLQQFTNHNSNSL